MLPEHIHTCAHCRTSVYFGSSRLSLAMDTICIPCHEKEILPVPKVSAPLLPSEALTSEALISCPLPSDL